MPSVSIVELLACQHLELERQGLLHLEQNHTAGINCNFSESTEFIQCLPVIYICDTSLGMTEVH